ncbi:hypothetical protein Q8A73_002730 [Channa argus]|nr:hypothetical protein Q8A73_002730 [Channa argus]
MHTEGTDLGEGVSMKGDGVNKEDILKTLEELTRDDFNRFKWFLQEEGVPDTVKDADILQTLLWFQYQIHNPLLITNRSSKRIFRIHSCVHKKGRQEINSIAKKVNTASPQDAKSQHVKISSIHHDATPLFRVQKIQLCAPKEAVTPHLRSMPFKSKF